MGEAQLDITFVSQDQNLLGVLTMTSNPDRDPLLLEGSLSNLIREEVIDLFIELPQDQLSVLSISEGEGSVVLLDDEGLSTDYSLSSYSVVSAIDDRYEIFSGVSTDPDGNTFDFVASTDPAAGTVVIVIVGIAVVGCLVAIGLQALISDCKTAMQTEIQACANSGGLPSLRANVVYGFTKEGGNFRVACTHECAVECRR